MPLDIIKMSLPKIVFGANGVWSDLDDTRANEIFDTLEAGGIQEFDTARFYGSSEELIGKYSAGSRFVVSTKHLGGLAPGQSIADVAKVSFDFLKLDQVDVYYIHFPDPTIPIEVTLEGINELYKLGRFKRFGLSNFSAEQVEEAVRIAKEKGYVVPSVYQGNYSALWRKPETQLFPTLRKHNIAFYAYSPVAGGFLTKTREQLIEGAGRFVDDGVLVNKIYRDTFVKPWYLDFVDKWAKISDESGISKSELALRWIVHHSALKGDHGDGVVIGATSMVQLQGNIDGLKKGPLPEAVVTQIEAAWDDIKQSALTE
ncbi:NADP-dependent oxidoreductase domain-containing protein [Cladochytrium replicatum]|nr:NADP-dependent oxidoreductase domain-containing protein [Cladochytrium replicatum]